MATTQVTNDARRTVVQREFVEEHGRAWVSWVVGSILLIAMAVGGWWYWQWAQKQAAESQQANKRSDKPVPVKAASTKRGDLPIFLDGVGNAVAFNSVVVRSRVDGQLMELKFKDGQHVKAKELLAVIDPRPFEAALKQMEAQKARDTALRDNAQRDLDRYQRAREAVPQQLIDTAAAQVAQYNAALEADDAQINNAQVQLAYTQITSPIEGEAGIRAVDVGNIIHASDASGLVTITQVRPISVIFTLSQGTLPQVQKAMRDTKDAGGESGGGVQVSAFDAFFKSKIATGVLATIDNQIDPTTLTYKLKATFQNPDGALYPNQSLNVRLLVDVRKNVVLAPSGAIQQSPNGAFVYVVKQDNTVEMRPIATGATEAGLTEVNRGLQADETVVTDGIDTLREGAKVTVSTDEQKGEAATTRGGRRGAAEKGATTKKAGGDDQGDGQ